MKILIAASESTPFIKTGGLADVAGALANEFSRMGVETALIMPLYKQIRESAADFGIKPLGRDVDVPLGNRIEKGILWEGKTPGGARALFIENDSFYDRDEIYGTPGGDFPDNAARFTFYARAVCETLKTTGMHFDVLHCNDWQTGLIPVYIKTLYRDDFPKTATILTIHNLGYQGLFRPEEMPVTGLGWDLFNMEGLEFYGKINFLKGGILFADAISTVSRNYAGEILSGEYGFGLDGVLRKRSADLYGILNGIDYSSWDPEKDHVIAANFNDRDFSGKAICKKSLKESCKLPPGESMLIGMVTRLSSQKGLDLVAETMGEIIALGSDFVILGKGDEFFHEIFLKLQKKYSKRLSLTLGFDDMLARRIYAGSDVFLMPSRYEPCGLGQLIALRYGTIPVARKTGGLADTITDYKPSANSGTGFLFSGYSPAEMFGAIKKAAGLFSNKYEWRKIQKNSMKRDFSWRRSAEEYLSVYRRAIKGRLNA